MRRRFLFGVLLILLVTTAGCASLVGGDSSTEPVLEATIVEPNTSVEGVGLNVEVTNTGESATEGTVFGTATLSNGSTINAVQRVDLEAGETRIVTLQWASIESLNGVEFQVTVDSD